MPLVAPNSKSVAALNASTVIAFAFNKLNVPAVVVKSPPLTAKSSVKVTAAVTPSVPEHRLPGASLR